MMEAGLVSVIVPVYNSGAYLPFAADSALAQTYPLLELVLVDDGSTDGSARVIEGYARRDGRVRALPLPHAGVSAARNAGIGAASGEYLFFLDSDDLIAPDCLERLVGAIDGADMSCIGSRMDTEQVDLSRYPHGNLEALFKRDVRHEDYLLEPGRRKLENSFGYIAGSSRRWNIMTGMDFKLYRSDILHLHDGEPEPTRHPEDMHYAEDLCFTLLYCRDVETVGCCEGIGVHALRRGRASLSSQALNIRASDLEMISRLWQNVFEGRSNSVTDAEMEILERLFPALLARSLSNACRTKAAGGDQEAVFQEAMESEYLRDILARHSPPGHRAKLLAFCLRNDAFWLYRLASKLMPAHA